MDITAAVLSAIGAQAPFTDSKPLAVERIRLDRPGPGEVLVRIKAAGLCLPTFR